MSTQQVQPSQVPQFDPEQVWHEQRKLGIGGSDVHHLFPCLDLNDKDDPGSRYGCPRKLSYEKLGIEPDYAHTPETLRLFERGHLMEDVAAQRYSSKTGRRVFRSNLPYVSKEIAFARVNIDRNIKADDRGVGRLECKSANEHVFLRMQKEGLPSAYLLQIQHTLMVTGSTWGAFSVVEVPDYVDSVIEQIADQRLRNRVLETLYPKFDDFYFEVERNENLIATIFEAEQKFWNLIENGKLADPLPDIKDDRCSSCNFRRTCRGQAYVDANAKIPVRDKKTGIQYVQIENADFAEVVADRLALMKDIDEKEEALKAVDNEIKQRWPKEVGAVSLASVKIRWNWQRGANRWDAEALKSDSPVIGRNLDFATWAAKNKPEVFAEFAQTVTSSPSLADKYQVQSAPSRPFVFSV